MMIYYKHTYRLTSFLFDFRTHNSTTVYVTVVAKPTVTHALKSDLDGKRIQVGIAFLLLLSTLVQLM